MATQTEIPKRKPLALANWKMAMTLAETRTFLSAFLPQVSDVAGWVDVVICPPFTAVHTLAQALAGTPIQVGAQNLHPGPGEAFTGEVSAALLADVGARWVLLGHWERRRHLGETDECVNRKVHAALAAGLRPILLIEVRYSETQDTLYIRRTLPNGHHIHRVILPVILTSILQRNITGRKFIHGYRPETLSQSTACPCPPGTSGERANDLLDCFRPFAYNYVCAD